MSAMTRSMNSSGGLKKIVPCVVKHRNQMLYAVHLLVIFEWTEATVAQKCPERSAPGVWGIVDACLQVGAVTLLWQLISVITHILVVKISLLVYFALSIGKCLSTIQQHAVPHLHPRLLSLPCWQAFEEDVTALVLNITQCRRPVRADIMRIPNPTLRTRCKWSLRFTPSPLFPGK